MSKKKNTLKDLDAFLKQQAATLVSPPRITPTVGENETMEIIAAAPNASEQPSPEPLREDAATALLKSARTKKELYDFILNSIESQENISPEDRMLINTVLYIKNGDNWKESIRAYWRHRRS